MRRRVLPLLVVLGACGPAPTEATWVRSFGFSWALFNHRLSRWSQPSDAAPVTVVGGASTIGTIYEEACYDRDTCAELPAFDEAQPVAEVVRARGDQTALVAFSAQLVVGAEGADTVVQVAVPPGASGRATAWIAGFDLDTNVPHTTSSCYDPRYGWLPTRWAMAVEAGSVEGGEVPVTVSGTFASGLSLEAIRTCLDEAAPGARVKLTVNGVVAIGPVEPWFARVERGAVWPWDADDRPEQRLEDIGARTVDLPFANPWIGWSSVDLRFHEQVEPGRGAYLRSVDVVADPERAELYAFATNRSATALSGFDFRFEGEAWLLPPETFEAP